MLTLGLFDALHSWAHGTYGLPPVRVRIRLVSGLWADLPIPSRPVQSCTQQTALPANEPSEAPAPEAVKTPFFPNIVQTEILKALNGKAMKTGALADVAAGGDQRRLFRKPGGLEELQQHGLVKHSKNVGFYRPDKPPEII